MILKRDGDTFTFELDGYDLASLARNLMDNQVRGTIYHRKLNKFIGHLDYKTMKFKPFNREKAGVEPLELEEYTEAFLMCH